MPTNSYLMPFVLIALAVATAMLQYDPHPHIADDLALQRIDGIKQRFDDFQGKPLLVTFWSPTCTVCMHEVKELNQLYQALGGGQHFDLLGISSYYDRPDQVLQASSRAGMTYPVYLDLDNSVGQAFGSVQTTPTSFVIDAQGNVVLKFNGKLDFDLVTRSLTELMV